MRTESLAGLGFEFTPFSLHLPAPGADTKQDGPEKGTRLSRPASASRPRRPPLSVSFNLAPRHPGRGYRPPDPARQDQGLPAAGNTHAAPHAAAEGYAASSAPTASGLHRLKLASLQRRPAHPTGATTATGAAAAVAAAADRDSARGTSSTAAEPAAGGAPPDAGSGTGALLAGCSSQVLEQMLPTPSPPGLVAAGRAVLAAPSNPREHEAEEPAFQIPAYRPEPVTDGDTVGADGCSSEGGAGAGGFTGDASVAGRRAAVSRPEQRVEPGARQLEPPLDVQAALRCLGLLPGAGEGAVESAHCCLRVRLRAAAAVLSAQQVAEAADGALALLRRLRHVRLHLAYHQVSCAALACHGCCLQALLQTVPQRFKAWILQLALAW